MPWSARMGSELSESVLFCGRGCGQHWIWMKPCWLKVGEGQQFIRSLTYEKPFTVEVGDGLFSWSSHVCSVWYMKNKKRGCGEECKEEVCRKQEEVRRAGSGGPR